MKWYYKKVDGLWKVYLEQKYCLTDEPVCYGASVTKETAARVVERLNDYEKWLMKK